MNRRTALIAAKPLSRGDVLINHGNGQIVIYVQFHNGYHEVQETCGNRLVLYCKSLPVSMHRYDCGDNISNLKP